MSQTASMISALSQAHYPKAEVEPEQTENEPELPPIETEPEMAPLDIVEPA